MVVCVSKSRACRYLACVFLSIDPGLSTGHAWWYPDGSLASCGVSPDGPPQTVDIRHLAIEVPKIYTARLMKGDPNNIVTLAVRVGRYIERYGQQGYTGYFPNEWKGTQTKDQHHPKIFMALSPKEKDIVRVAGEGLTKKSLADLLDAIGIGQYARKMGQFK